MNHDARSAWLTQRQTDIIRGLREAIRPEVQRRGDLGLPIHVAQDGQVIALPATESGGK